MNQSKLYKIRLVKGDTVVVLSGKYKGKTGKVLQIHPSLNKVSVEGLNIVKKHQKPTKANPQGGIVDLLKPIWASKLSVIEPTSKKPSRIGIKTSDSGKSVRIYKKSGKEIK